MAIVPCYAELAARLEKLVSWDILLLVARFGAAASLSQLVLKTMLPGVPDFYQGTELWDFSLVDPDNRRPVDFIRRQTLLNDNANASAWDSELFKFHVMRRLLALRNKFPDTFRLGTYQPIPLPDHRIIAFTRLHRQHQVLVIVARRFSNEQQTSAEPIPLRGTKVPQHDVLRDRVLTRENPRTFADILRDDPVAVLSSAPLFA